MFERSALQDCVSTYVLQVYELHMLYTKTSHIHVLHMYHICNTHVAHFLLIYDLQSDD